MSAPRRVTFPHMGNYAGSMATLAEMLGAEAVPPPAMTKRTLEIGAKHSPEFVCVPFKYNLGNFIEALDRGANVVVQAGGGCRFGYYAEVQEQILRDLGYELDFITLTGDWSLLGFIRTLRGIQPAASDATAAYAFAVGLRQAKAIERAEDFIRRNVGFETRPGGMDAVLARLLGDLREARSMRAVARVEAEALEALAAVPIDKPETPMRVGVVGELYVVMEPFANHDIERKLAERGIEVHRSVTLTGLVKHGIFGRRYRRDIVAAAQPWVRYHLGADGTESVARTWEMMNAGFDGMVHLKPFGCMPEVSAMSVLQRISREHTFPVLFMSYDAQTAQTGVLTRIEAFVDMIETRRRGVLASA